MRHVSHGERASVISIWNPERRAKKIEEEQAETIYENIMAWNFQKTVQKILVIASNRTRKTTLRCISVKPLKTRDKAKSYKQPEIKCQLLAKDRNKTDN